VYKKKELLKHTAWIVFLSPRDRKHDIRKFFSSLILHSFSVLFSMHFYVHQQQQHINTIQNHMPQNFRMPDYRSEIRLSVWVRDDEGEKEKRTTKKSSRSLCIFMLCLNYVSVVVVVVVIKHLLLRCFRFLWRPKSIKKSYFSKKKLHEFLYIFILYI
jgi:hypothetical protein